MRNRTILVTGGAGFIGSHLVDRLLERNFKVIVLDDFSSGNINNIWHHLTNKGFKLVRGSVLDKELVYSVVSNVDLIVHLAAQVHVDRSILEPEYTVQVNTIGTLNVLEAARKHEVELIIHMSSCEVYGTARYVPMDEKHPLNPTSPYAASKAAADRLAYSYYNTYKLPVVIVRAFNVYGPRQRDKGYAAVIPKFIRRVLGRRPPVIYGDGKQTRDYLYVDDMIRALELVMEHGEKLVGMAVNIGSGCEVSILELAYKILELADMQSELKPVFAPSRPGEVRRLIADIELAERELGFRPSIPLEEGLKRLIEWYKGGGYDAWRAYVYEEL